MNEVVVSAVIGAITGAIASFVFMYYSTTFVNEVRGDLKEVNSYHSCYSTKNS